VEQQRQEDDEDFHQLQVANAARLGGHGVVRGLPIENRPVLIEMEQEEATNRNYP
jgi:hypothetical protein